MRQIKTIQGDTWDKISLREYGTENFMNKLISANPDKRKKVIFKAGEFLNVPEIEQEAAEISEDLPPWKM